LRAAAMSASSLGSRHRTCAAAALDLAMIVLSLDEA
jgi:hypothetical protein